MPGRQRWRPIMPSRCCAMRRAGCWPTTTPPRCRRPSAAGASPPGQRNWPSRHDLNTILSRRDYRSGAWHLGALSSRQETARWSLEDLAAAMRQPCFVPYLGRKSCPLGLPLAPRISDAADAPAALLDRHENGPEARLNGPGGRTLRGMLADPPVATTVVMDADQVVAGDARHRRTEMRRDQPRSRRRWQFDPAAGGGARHRRRHERLVSVARIACGATRPWPRWRNCLCPRRPAQAGGVAQAGLGAVCRPPRSRARLLVARGEAGPFHGAVSRPPEIRIGLFDLDYKPFAPVLSAGDRLGFTLRANPVVARLAVPGERGKRHDVVMDALHAVPMAIARLHGPTSHPHSWAGVVGAPGRGAWLYAGWMTRRGWL